MRLFYTADVALALLHLLEMADCFPADLGLAAEDDDGSKCLERQPRTEVLQIAAAGDHACLAGDVALLANGGPQFRVEMLRIDNSGIDFGGGRMVGGCYVALPGPVAALAADGEAVEYRPLVTIGVSLHGPNAVGMAKEALGRNWPARAPVGNVSGRYVPNLFLAEPTDGSLEQVAVVIGEE